MIKGNEGMRCDALGLDPTLLVSLPLEPEAIEGARRAPIRGATLDPIALASFFASLAHDLRSPLGVVGEAISELRADFSGQLSDEHRLLVSLAERGLLRLGRIADAVSLTSALETGTLEIRRRPLDLVELLAAASATAIALEPRREVELRTDLPAAACPILADGPKLGRAFVELLINAIRFARRKALLRLEIVGGEARVSIEDDGQGVPIERRPALFLRFTPRTSRTGLGVGLSNADEVISAHGGRLSFEASTLPAGQAGTVGARFVVSLAYEGAP